FAKRAVSPALAADVSLPAVSHGHGHRPYAYQYARGDRSIAGGEIILHAHAEIPRAVQSRQSPGTEISPAPQTGPLAGTAGGHVLRINVPVRLHQRELLDHPIPAAVCAGVLVHRTDVSAARPV